MVLTPCIWVTSYYHPGLILERARSISTHTSKKWFVHNNLDEVQPSSTSNSVKPSFDLHNIMAMIQ